MQWHWHWKPVLTKKFIEEFMATNMLPHPYSLPTDNKCMVMAK
jgi:hypothetical protein